MVGASTTPGKVGHDIFLNILKSDFQGTLFPVDSKAHAVKCVKAYPSLTDLPEAPDRAILVVSPKAALAAVEEGSSRCLKGGASIFRSGVFRCFAFLSTPWNPLLPSTDSRCLNRQELAEFAVAYAAERVAAIIQESLAEAVTIWAREARCSPAMVSPPFP